MDPYNVIKYPLSTEKSIRLMEAENKLIFVVDKKSTKKLIKKAIEDMFKVEVDNVNTFVNADGEKERMSNSLQRILPLILQPNWV